MNTVVVCFESKGVEQETTCTYFGSYLFVLRLSFWMRLYYILQSIDWKVHYEPLKLFVYLEKLTCYVSSPHPFSSLCCCRTKASSYNTVGKQPARVSLPSMHTCTQYVMCLFFRLFVWLSKLLSCQYVLYHTIILCLFER